MKGTRTPLEVRNRTAQRIIKGEEVEDIAKELSLSTFTIRDWVRDFKRNSGGKGVKRKAAPKKITRAAPRRNVVQEKISGLQKEVEFWKGKYTELLYQST